jgi:hypothetical protein
LLEVVRVNGQPRFICNICRIIKFPVNAQVVYMDIIIRCLVYKQRLSIFTCLFCCLPIDYIFRKACITSLKEL